jgi:hypothetical protein
MINFRFHIASLIAVFLALALGVVMGSTVVQRAIVDSLRDQIDRVERNVDSQRAKNAALSAENDRLNLYVAESAPYAVGGALTGQSVAVLAERGIDEDAVKAQVALLQTAGARVAGTLWLESAWNLADPASADALRTATGSTTRNNRTLRAEALDDSRCGWPRVRPRGKPTSSTVSPRVASSISRVPGMPTSPPRASRAPGPASCCSAVPRARSPRAAPRWG